ncbi:MAG: plasmid replication protein, CyRepA1 family, partial [Phototrophicaceae bacterium]
TPEFAICAGETTVTLRYLSEMPLDGFLARGVTLIASPQATGKTALMERLSVEWKAQNKVVRYISPLTTLTSELSRRMDCESQLALYPDQQSRPSALATTLPSLVHQVDRASGELRRIDVLVLDEIEQTLAALFADIHKHERMSIYTTLVEAIRRADIVIGLDADASAVAYDFLRGIRDDVTVIVNRYQDTSRQLIPYNSDAALIKALDETIKTSTQVIGVACSSEKTAKSLARRYSKQVGEAGVLLVCQDTKHDPRVKEFFKHPDAHAGNYRMVIYTSAMGTGVDLSQTAAAAVFGFFGRFPLTAWDMHQMLVRFRQAAAYHVWVDKTEMPKFETDPQAIYNTLLEKERITKQAILFHDGVNVAQQTRLQLAQLQAAVEARLHRSQRALRQHFMAIAAQRFTVLNCSDEISISEQRDIKLAINQDQQLAQQEREKRILTATPVDSSSYRAAAMRGELTQALEDGHARFIIEREYAQPLDDQTVTDYDDGRGLKRLALFESLFRPEAESKQLDTHELEAGMPLGDLSHATMRRMLALQVLALTVDNKHLSDRSLIIEEIDHALWPVIDRYGKDIERFFGWRRDHSHKPINLLRFIARECGLYLERHRKSDGYMRYRLNAAQLARMERYVQQRLMQKSEEGLSLSPVASTGGV